MAEFDAAEEENPVTAISDVVHYLDNFTAIDMSAIARYRRAYDKMNVSAGVMDVEELKVQRRLLQQHRPSRGSP